MLICGSVAGSALFYVCNSDQFGEARGYDPADPEQLSRFRALLHRIAKAAVT